MLTLPPPPFRKHRRPPRRRPPVAAPTLPLNLVAASYTIDEFVTLTLTFDRAIDISGLDGTVIFVRDGDETHTLWHGTGGAELLGPAIVQITLNEFDPESVPGIVLSASATSGIVAVDDGGQWAGASNLPLPYP